MNISRFNEAVNALKKLAHEYQDKSIFWFEEMHKYRRGSEEYNRCAYLSDMFGAREKATRTAIETMITFAETC